jgi:dTDP-glucose 4,6-dehydratase
MDITKIKRVLGWEPRQSLASGLLKTVEWYLSHPEWINAIRQQGEYQGWMKLNYKAREGRYKKL